MYKIFRMQVDFLSFHFLVICFCTLLFSGCSKTVEPQPDDEPPTFDIPSAEINLAKPLEISQNPKDVALCQKVNATIDESEFRNARWGVIAIGLQDGRIICGRDAQKLFNPASIQKLLTSIVALDKLGDESRVRTSVYSKNKIENGVLKNDLVLYGRGAPDLDDAEISKLAASLNQKGLTKIEGDIVGDESYFKGDGLGDGWTWNAAQWYYGAAASALSINKNLVTVSLEKGKPKSDSKFVELSGEVQPIEDIEAIGLKRELGTNKVYVWGNGKNLKARIAISNPALLAAKIFKEQLEKNGVDVLGEAKSVDWKSNSKLYPADLKELASTESETLAETVREMNKDSVNLYAELILRILGKKHGTEAPDENPKFQKLRGDDLAGAAVIKKWLKEHDIAAQDIAIHDGSGLSRLDFVTPEAIGRALVYAAQSKFSDTLKNSLPVSGTSGTLRGRLKNVSGRVLGKTGSITYVSSLAGYAKSKGETYAFVIISNNETHKAEVSKTIDQVASILVKN